MSKLKHIVKKEFRQVLRSREIMRMIFIMPVVQLLVLGNAINLDVKHIRLAIYDSDKTSESRDIISKFQSSPYFDLSVSPTEKLAQSLDDGKADIAVVIPQGFAEDLKSGKTAKTQIIVDAQNSNLAGISAGYVNGVFSSFQSDYRDNLLAANPQIKSQIHNVDLVSRVFYNPEMKSTYYMIPALVVMLLTMITCLLTALNIVREKELGTLEQLMVTPISKTEFMIGKTLPFAVLGLAMMSIALSVGVFAFKIPFSGNLLLLYGTAVLFIFTTLGIGLIISTVSTTQQQALFTTWFFLVFCILMSGFMTPVENMPEFMQKLTYLNPLKYFIKIVRSIFLKGSTFADLKFEIFALAIMGIVVTSTAIARFRKTTA